MSYSHGKLGRTKNTDDYDKRRSREGKKIKEGNLKGGKSKGSRKQYDKDEGETWCKNRINLGCTESGLTLKT